MSFSSKCQTKLESINEEIEKIKLKVTSQPIIINEPSPPNNYSQISTAKETDASTTIANLRNKIRSLESKLKSNDSGSKLSILNSNKNTIFNDSSAQKKMLGTPILKSVTCFQATSSKSKKGEDAVMESPIRMHYTHDLSSTKKSIFSSTKKPTANVENKYRDIQSNLKAAKEKLKLQKESNSRMVNKAKMLEKDVSSKSNITSEMDALKIDIKILMDSYKRSERVREVQCKIIKELKDDLCL